MSKSVVSVKTIEDIEGIVDLHCGDLNVSLAKVVENVLLHYISHDLSENHINYAMKDIFDIDLQKWISNYNEYRKL